MKHNRLCAAIVLFLVTTPMIHGAVALPKVIGDNMVLQQGKPLLIWGSAAAGERVTVRFADQEKSATADGGGKWRVTLEPVATSAQPREMTITAGNTVRLSNILVGEVWFCSGQSNMEYATSRSSKMRPPTTGVTDVAMQELASSPSLPSIRLFHVEKKLTDIDVTSDGWNECRGEALRKFSAVGYFFGKEIHRKLNVPIGLIESDWGGTRIEVWTPEEAYAAHPAFKDDPTTRPLYLDGSPVGKNFHHMVEPIIPFALAGFLWYQGESNCMNNDGHRYTDKMEAMVNNWRQRWGDAAAPFYYVQIAPFSYSRRKDAKPHTAETLPEFWEAQTDALTRISNTAMVVTTDLIDTWKDIHPSNKWDIGHRLALVALAKTYGRAELEYSGPMFKSMEVRDGKAILSFDHLGGGLQAKGDAKLTWFTIAGADGKFVPADALIDGDRVVVSSATVAMPTAVRFAWDEHAEPNLFNKAGLPAVPFRTERR